MRCSSNAPIDKIVNPSVTSALVETLADNLSKDLTWNWFLQCLVSGRKTVL